MKSALKTTQPTKSSPILKGNPKNELNPVLLQETCKARQNFSISVANIIKEDANSNDTSSTVIGLEGNWGSGKTHITTLIKKEFAGFDEFEWLEFQPWTFTDKEHLSKIYLEWLSNEFKKNLDFQDKAIIFSSKYLIAFGTFLPYLLASTTALVVLSTIFWISTSYVFPKGLVPLGLVALFFIGIAYFLINTLISNFINKIPPLLFREYSHHLNDALGLERLKEKINKILLSDSYKIRRSIIVIEDIDRLSPGQISAVFQLIKMVADFPKTTYLIPYDSEHVQHALNIHFGRNIEDEFSKGYIHKTFHLTAHIPPTDQKSFFKFLDERFRNYTQDKHFRAVQFSSGYYEIVEIICSTFIKTFRDVEKLYNRAILLADNISEGSNPADTIAVAFLQEFEPEFWGKIVLFSKPQFDQKSDIFSYFNNRYMGLTSEDEYSEITEYLTNSIKKFEPKQLIDFIGVYVFHGATDELSGPRLGNPKHFNKYAAFSTTGGVSLAVLAQDFIKADHPNKWEAALKKLQFISNDEKASLYYFCTDLIACIEQGLITKLKKDLLLQKLTRLGTFYEGLHIAETRRMFTLLLNAPRAQTFPYNRALIQEMFDKNLIEVPLWLATGIHDKFIDAEQKSSTTSANEIARFNQMLENEFKQWTHNNDTLKRVVNSPHAALIMKQVNILDKTSFKLLVNKMVFDSTAEVTLKALMIFSSQDSATGIQMLDQYIKDILNKKPYVLFEELERLKSDNFAGRKFGTLIDDCEYMLYNSYTEEERKNDEA